MTTAAALLPRSKDPVSQLMALVDEQRRELEAAGSSTTDASWDPFAPAWVHRLSLCDSLSRLLFLDLETALDGKLEQELWSVGFKEPVAAAQRAARGADGDARLAGAGQAKLAALLEHGLGFYTNLLQELCTVFQVSLPCRKRLTHGTVLEPVVLRVKAKWPTKGSLAYLCQHCLVHLGDLCRYQRRSDQAGLYYTWAVQTCPTNGHPFNQLAILASQAESKQLCTFFYYIRAISCATPFTAARANLEKLLAGQARAAKACLGGSGGSGHERPGVLFLHYHALLSAARDVARARQLWDAFMNAYALRPDTNWEECVQMVAIHVFAMHRLLTQGEPDTSELLSLQRQATAQLIELLADIGAAALAGPGSTSASAAAATAASSLPQLAGLHVLLRWCDLKPSASLSGLHQQQPPGLPRLAYLLNRLQRCLPALLSQQQLRLTIGEPPLPELQLLRGFLPLFPKGRAQMHDLDDKQPPQHQQQQQQQQQLPLPSPESIGRQRASRCVALGLRLAASLPACLLAQQAPGSEATAAWSFAAPVIAAPAASAVKQQQQQLQTSPPKRSAAKPPNQQNVALQSLLSNRIASQPSSVSASAEESPSSAGGPAAQPRGKLVLSSEIARSIQEHAAQVASAKASSDQSPTNPVGGSTAVGAPSGGGQLSSQQQQQQQQQRIKQLPPRFQRKLLEQQQPQLPPQQQQQPSLSLLAKKESEPIFPSSLFQRPPPTSAATSVAAAATAAAGIAFSASEHRPPPLPIGRGNWPIGAVPQLESLTLQQEPQQHNFRDYPQTVPSYWPPPEQ